MQAALRITTIVAAIDGSDHADKALELAADLAEKYAARLILLHVLSDKPMSEDERHLAEVEYHADFFDKIDTGALIDVRGDPRSVASLMVKQYGDAVHKIRQITGEQLMAKAQARVQAMTVQDVETVIDEGDPAKSILATAKNMNADLIILGSRGLSDLKGLLMGSVSHKVSQLSECTCITVK